VSYQSIVTHGQHDTFGTQLGRGGPRDGTDAHVLVWYAEYGLSDRIAVHASLPYMQVRYQGGSPHRVGLKGQPSNLDDGTYHGSFQDFYFGTRFALLESARFAVTPFVETIVPSHHYESLGQASVGRDLRSLVVGAAIGSFADYLVPGLHFQTRLSYTLVQKAVDIRPNHTAIDSGVGYFVTPRLAIEFIETFQLTHDGIDWVGPPRGLAVHNRDVWNRDYGLNHDRLARSNALSLGAGASFALGENVGVFGTVTKLAWGQNLSAPRSVTVGMNWGFQTRGSTRPTPNVNRPLAFRGHQPSNRKAM
jgi:hypothetical protein